LFALDTTIRIIVDNNTLIDRYFYGEPAFSLYIESNGLKLLFDTGYSGILLENSSKMSVNLLGLDYIVISHGHIDHTGGLEALSRLFMEASSEGIPHKRPEIIAHPRAFFRKKLKNNLSIGSSAGLETLRGIFPVRLSKEPLKLGNFTFLGEIPSYFPFEAEKPMGYMKDTCWQEDYLLDDSAMAIETDSGLVIITGCSHRGICNITRHALNTAKQQYIADIIGGFHLIDASNDTILQTAQQLQAYAPECVHPCHCTGMKALLTLDSYVKVKESGVGLKLVY